MYYKVSIQNPSQHFIQFEFESEVEQNDQLLLQLPTWRPGRYELGYFAKNIRNFQVNDKNGKSVIYEKIGHSQWLIHSKNKTKIIVRYQYYANELNAGSTFLNEEQLYINPVNCFCYKPEATKCSYSIDFSLPKDYSLVCSLKKRTKTTLLAKDHWELFDSPLIASSSWEKKTYEVKGVKFHIVFQGAIKPDWDTILKDFKQFTQKQIQCFGGFPVKEYWFLVQMPSYPAYHGVEHERSTVIALGPGYKLMSPVLYDRFLGICSHELYHTWNVKNIKPAEFSPYDFSKENYNRIGYIIEGITTYMGDKMLWKAGVRSEAWFRDKLVAQYQRHMWNEGRFNHSVRDSSFDTWLDGYVAGIPGRKVSIYTEGALLAFILDVELLRNSKNKKSLDTVMKEMYKSFGGSNNGYLEKDFWSIVQKVHGKPLDDLFDNFHKKAVSYDSKFNAALKKMRWKLLIDESDVEKALYGLIAEPNSSVIAKIHPQSDAYNKGLSVGDKIIAVNGHVLNNDLADWILFYKDQRSIMLHFESNGMLNELMVNKKGNLYCNYRIVNTKR